MDLLFEDSLREVINKAFTADSMRKFYSRISNMNRYCCIFANNSCSDSINFTWDCWAIFLSSTSASLNSISFQSFLSSILGFPAKTKCFRRFSPCNFRFDRFFTLLLFSLSSFTQNFESFSSYPLLLIFPTCSFPFRDRFHIPSLTSLRRHVSYSSVNFGKFCAGYHRCSGQILCLLPRSAINLKACPFSVESGLHMYGSVTSSSLTKYNLCSFFQIKSSIFFF